MGIDILRDVKMWESEGFVNVRSISRSVNVIYLESYVLYSCGVILCCVRGSFLGVLGGAGGCKVDCKFSRWVTCISQRTKTAAAFAATVA